jgi:hypothetical protein
MHKELQGLVDVYKYMSNEKALQMALNLVDGFVTPFVKHVYALGGVDRMQYVLQVEFGGMQDVLYQVYGLTKFEEHKWYV